MSALEDLVALAAQLDGGDDEAHDLLAHECKWFAAVSRGEAAGDPETFCKPAKHTGAVPRLVQKFSHPSEGWLERGRELASGQLSNVELTPRTAEASTVPEPTVPPGGPGLFHIKGRELPPYIQHLWHHLAAKYGKHRAYGIAVGVVKKWAAGINPGGKHPTKTHADVRAAAQKNVAEWEKDRSDAHADDKESKHTGVVDRLLSLAGGPTKSKAEVHYRPTASTTRRCGTCSMFRDGACTLVKGKIDPSDVCDEYDPAKVGLARPYERTEHGREEHVSGYIPHRAWVQGQQNVTKGGNMETYAQADKDKPPLGKPKGNIVFDFDGVLKEGAHYHWPPPGGVDFSGIGKAHDRGYSAAIVTANDPPMVGQLLEKYGYHPVYDPGMGRWSWHGGDSGRDVLVTGRKVAAAAYIDDRAINHQFGDNWDETLDDVERVRHQRHPLSGIARAQAELEEDNSAGLTVRVLPADLRALALAAVRPYERTSPRGREEEVRGYGRIDQRAVVRQAFYEGRPLGPEAMEQAAHAKPVPRARSPRQPHSKPGPVSSAMVSGEAPPGRQWIPKPDWKQGQKNVTKSGNLETYSQASKHERKERDSLGKSKYVYDNLRKMGFSHASAMLHITSILPMLALTAQGEVALAAPRGWPSGPPQAGSMLPPSKTAPGAKPMYYGRMAHTPSQTTVASPPLPPGVGLPDPKDVLALASDTEAAGDSDFLVSAGKHLRAAATALTHKGSLGDVLLRLRSAQTGINGARREAQLDALPVANVFSSSLNPAEQSSARGEMVESLATRNKYRALAQRVAVFIDQCRRTFFHGQYPPGYPSGWSQGGTPSSPAGGNGASLTHGNSAAILALVGKEVEPYWRTEQGHQQHVSGYHHSDSDSKWGGHWAEGQWVPAQAWKKGQQDIDTGGNLESWKQANQDWANALSGAEHTVHKVSAMEEAAEAEVSPHPEPAHGPDLKEAAGYWHYHAVPGHGGMVAPVHVKNWPMGPIVHVSAERTDTGHHANVDLFGEQAYKAIAAKQAQGEFNEKQGNFLDSNGLKHWGWDGGAGLLVSAPGEDGKTRYLIQKRSYGVQLGGTWSTPGGAIDRKPDGTPETPQEAAIREGEEEFGAALPADAQIRRIHTASFGEGPGKWTYHTVEVHVPQTFDPQGKGVQGIHGTSWESAGYQWATPEEMADLPLHPGFQPTAVKLGMDPEGGKKPPPPAPVWKSDPQKPNDYTAGERVTWFRQGKIEHGVVTGDGGGFVYDEKTKKLPAYYAVKSDSGWEGDVAFGQLRLESAPKSYHKKLTKAEKKALKKQYQGAPPKSSTSWPQGYGLGTETAAHKAEQGTFANGDRISYQGSPGTVVAVGISATIVKMDDGQVKNIVHGDHALKRKVGEVAGKAQAQAKAAAPNFVLGDKVFNRLTGEHGTYVRMSTENPWLIEVMQSNGKALWNVKSTERV